LPVDSQNLILRDGVVKRSAASDYNETVAEFVFSCPLAFGAVHKSGSAKVGL
jgi:hypothetical protein